MTGRRIRVVWNANAGRKAGLPTNRGDEQGLRDLMARHDLGDELVPTDSEEAGAGAAREAAAAGYHAVIAAGGDGTAAVVARELLDSETALGLLPRGSIMNIARMLGVPRDLDEAARALRGATPRRIDVGQVDGDGVFFEAASVGLHAAVFREAERADRGEHLAILRSIVAAFRYRPSRMTLEIDEDPDEERRTRALLVAVANGPYMGAGFTVAPDARLDDGAFDVRIFRHWSKRELVRHFASIAFGRRAYAPHVETVRARSIRIEGVRPLPARADARDLGVTPVTFRVRPGALLVLAPGPDDQRAVVGANRG